jgi:hypothetical protein
VLKWLHEWTSEKKKLEKGKCRKARRGGKERNKMKKRER